MQIEDNITAVLYRAGDLRLEKRPISEPKDDEVLLKICVVGICGSDLHLVNDGRIGPKIVDKPAVLGHEVSGIVWKVGNNVLNLKKGDRVAVDPGVHCFRCDPCRSGRGNLCVNAVFAGTLQSDGCLSRYFAHSADFCYRLPDHVSLEEGALVELVSVAIHACKQGRVGHGSVVLVQGAGPVGLMSLLVSKALGASKVLVTDYIQARLDKAKEIGADFIVQVHPRDSADVVKQKVISALGGDPTTSIDCVGSELTITVAVRATASGGVAVIVGFHGLPAVNIPITEAVIREIDIRGNHHYNNYDYHEALEMVATGTIDVKPLITHHYKIDEVQKAFNTATTREDNAIKVLIHTD
uniref:Sorbitol dehydrogenase n=2 Tax=Photinus pyralis TaxID=7054 RepID=A0A1Y1NA46_PHOPY